MQRCVSDRHFACPHIGPRTCDGLRVTGGDWFVIRRCGKCSPKGRILCETFQRPLGCGDAYCTCKWSVL